MRTPKLFCGINYSPDTLIDLYAVDFFEFV